MGERPERPKSRLGKVLLYVLVGLLVLGAIYWWQSRPATVEVGRITEIQIDSDGDGLYDDAQYFVGGVSVGRFDTGNITLKVQVADISPLP